MSPLPSSSHRSASSCSSSCHRGDALGFNIRSVATALLGAGPTAEIVWIAAGAGLTFAAVVRFRALVRPPTNDISGAFAIAACLTYAVSPVTWAHHLSFTIVALALWASRASTLSHVLVAGSAAVLLLDPLAIGGSSILVAACLVAFCALTVVALPSARPSIP